MSPRSSARVNSTSVMNAALQSSVDGRFPMNPLLLRPMGVQFEDLTIPLRRQRGASIRYRRFGVLFAVRKNADLDLAGRERRCHHYILHPAVPRIVCCEQPEPILAIGACGSKHCPFALQGLCRLDKTR